MGSSLKTLKLSEIVGDYAVGTPGLEENLITSSNLFSPLASWFARVLVVRPLFSSIFEEIANNSFDFWSTSFSTRGMCPSNLGDGHGESGFSFAPASSS